MGNTHKQSRTYPVNDIFSSIQGEGFWTGLPVTFIRFAGCNLACDFCDTDYSMKEILTTDEILRQLESWPARTVVLTGGEPLIHPLKPLLKRLQSAHFRIHLETNGTFSVPEGFFDWIAVSPKTDKPVVRKCHELRVLLKKGEIPHDFGIRADHYFVSPVNPPLNNPQKIDHDNLRYCLEYVLSHPKWRLSVQLHKYLDIP
ncbi:MAG: 7-carboxy-7-deazaguanine synthase [Candidatus Marinimicrobia bacterium]|jgi:organic radical activating enzyme|nr:7-carboxy-7-deazaguanine synthase [Candidatus Neomarinimicrobiota bacterium]